MLLRCWPDCELQHDHVKAKHKQKQTKILPVQGKLLLKTIQKNVVRHKNTENIQKRRKAQKSINKITKNAKKTQKN